MNDQVKAAVLREGRSSNLTSHHQPYLNSLVTAVCAPAMSLSGRDGQVRSGGADGFYVQDLRALSELVLTVDGAEPVPLGYDLVGGPTNVFHGAVMGAGNAGPDLSVFIRRRRALTAEAMVEDYTMRSYARSPVSCRVGLQLGCDLAPIAYVRSGLHPSAQKAAAGGDGLVWDVPGRGRVRVVGSPGPTFVDPATGSMGWDVTVGPGQAVTRSLSVESLLVESLSVEPLSGERHDQQAAPVFAPAPAEATGGAALPVPRVEAVDQRLGRLIELGLTDLGSLRMVGPANPTDMFLAAGAPWYLTLFGRDSIWAARMLLPLGTDLALGTLRTLARRQGRAFDIQTGEQPGKILHEVRRPPIENQERGSDRLGGRPPSLPPVYYGTVDATPLWVCLLHDAWKWGMSASDVRPLLAPMGRCLTWVAESGCRPDGFVSYVDESGRGLANQGWKDSSDAVQFRDGRIARAPIALCEVQGYAYQAAMGGAELLDAFCEKGAGRWREFAARLAERFRARFWVADNEGPYPAIALEDDGTAVDSLSSNIGHLLRTGILSSEECELVARRLDGPDLNSGFGLRTLAASSRGFNPLSYHCGSVWAHDTAIAIDGLARTPGVTARGAVTSLTEGLLCAAEAFRYRVPELYGGHERSSLEAPLPYPASCHPQSWSAAAGILVLTALLGIQPDVPAGTVRVGPPGVPTALRCVEGLRVGGSGTSVHIDADGVVRVTGLPPGLRVLADAL